MWLCPHESCDMYSCHVTIKHLSCDSGSTMVVWCPPTSRRGCSSRHSAPKKQRPRHKSRAERKTGGSSGPRNLLVAGERRKVCCDCSPLKCWSYGYCFSCAGAKKPEKDDNYVHYAPPDMYSEKGYVTDIISCTLSVLSWILHCLNLYTLGCTMRKGMLLIYFCTLSVLFWILHYLNLYTLYWYYSAHLRLSLGVCCWYTFVRYPYSFEYYIAWICILLHTTLSISGYLWALASTSRRLGQC